MDKKIYIATVAEKGGGKGLFFELVKKLLPNKRVVMIRSSDFWRQILHILCKEESRGSIDTLATAIRNAFGDDGVLIAPLIKQLETIDADVIILDGLRKREEVEMIKDRGGVVVFISAQAEVRFQRRKEHVENSDERDMTLEQFIYQDQLASNRTVRSINETMADVRIENNGTREEFEEKIGLFLNERVIL